MTLTRGKTDNTFQRSDVTMEGLGEDEDLKQDRGLTRKRQLLGQMFKREVGLGEGGGGWP